MRRLASIVAILLLLAAAAPVMACMTSVVMSREESAYCRAMHGQCGGMTKMGCCRMEIRTDETPQIAPRSNDPAHFHVRVFHLVCKEHP